MKVVLINHSDTLGGASVVTYRLMMALVAQGVDARMLVMNKSGHSLRVEQLEPAWRRKACFLAEHAEIYLRNGFNRGDVFKASIATCGMAVSRHPWVVDADCVILSWVNQGMVSLKEIGKIKAPVVWMMHDMWCMTGVCHHAGECSRYRQECGHCPLMRHGATERDLSRSTWQHKERLYSQKPISFVAVSHWLAERCAESRLLARRDVRVIPNPFPLDDFYTEPRKARAKLGLPEGKLIVMAAARLDDPIKGLPLAVEALNALNQPFTAVFVGAIRDPEALRDLRRPHVELGMVGETDLREIYAHADVVLSSSHYETLPGTLVEGMAAGCVPVTFGQGGQSDIVDHLATGYIARYPDTGDLARGLEWALIQPVDAQTLRQTVHARFNPVAVAQAYMALFNDLKIDN